MPPESLALAVGSDVEEEPALTLRHALDHLSNEPGNVEASRVAARGLSRLLYPDEAEPHYDRLRAAGRFDRADAQARALGLTRANRREEAVAAYEAILAEAPDDPQALQRLAAVEWARGRGDKALGPAALLAETAEGAVAGHALLAQINLSLSRWEEAVTHYRRALELDPELKTLSQPWGLFTLEFGEVLLRTGRTAEARSVLTTATARDSEIGLVELLGQACLEEGDLDEADRHLRRVAERSPDRPKPWRTLGRINLKARRNEEALAFLNRAEALEPGDYEALSLLATVHKVLGHENEAKAFEARAAEARRALPASAGGMGAVGP